MSKPLLEIACFTEEWTKKANESGADRIELCIDYQAGGISPGKELVRKVLTSVGIPVFVMIRPRPGYFVYSESEFRQMKEFTRFCLDSGVPGIVAGMLRNDDTICTEQLEELVKLAGPMEFTFHRAIDHCPDILKSVEQLKATGVKRILSSGGKPQALDGCSVLKEMVAAAGEHMIVVPGGGVNSANILEILKKTGAREIHGSAKSKTGIIPEPDLDEINAMIERISR
jgi:copper homeostasis protein